MFRARMSQFHDSTALQLLAVQRAERALRDGEAKLQMIKKWGREIENQTDPLLKQLNQLQGFLTADMGKAVAHLAQVIRALHAYASVAAPGGLSSMPETKSAPGNAEETSA